jgi:phosphoribosylaminoimidazole-succinocarboxamide synthase
MSGVALQLYKAAAKIAESKGIILADTKFEFGLVPSSSGSGKELILIDELLTPDSSRYWPQSKYGPGRPQDSYDKQYVRDWLVGKGYRKGLEGGPEGHVGEGWVIEEEVVQRTRQKYAEAVKRLTQ